MTKKAKEKDLEEEPTFPLTQAAKRRKAKANGEEKTKDQAPPPETWQEEEKNITPKEKISDRLSSKRSIDASINDAAKVDDPTDIYETWRERFVKGIHKLKVWYREPDSKTFVAANPPFWDFMPPFDELCEMHNKGAYIKVAIYKPNSYGKLSPVTGPVEIPIAPQGEYQMSGFGNPWRGGGNAADAPGSFSLDRLLEFSSRESDRREKLQQEMLSQSQNSTNTWLQALLNNPGKDNQGSDKLFYAMMQQQNQQAQMQMQMQRDQMNMMIQQMQQNTQILVSALSGNKDNDALTKVFELQTQQNQFLMQQMQANQGDLHSQIAILKDLQELTEPTTIAEFAKLAEALDLGSSIKALTGATAERIKGKDDGDDINQPAPPVPAPRKPLPPATTKTQPAPQRTTQTPPQTQAAPDPKDSGLFEMIAALKIAYISGHDAQEVAQTFLDKQQGDLPAELQNLDPEDLYNKAKPYLISFGAKELSTTAGKDFVVSFLQNLKEGSAHVSTNQ